MPGRFSPIHTFRRGCLGNNGRLLLLLVNDELAASNTPHCGVVLWVNGRFQPITTTSWLACAAVYLDWPDAEFAVVGETGQLLLVARDGAFREEAAFPGPPSGPGKFRGASCLDKVLYIVGAGYWAVEIQANGARRDISPARQAGTQFSGVGFEAITGFDSTEIYAVGWDGEIARYDGSLWEPISSPTNLILSSAVSTEDGVVWAGGQRGILVAGRGNSWSAVDVPVADNIWSLASFQGRVCFCTTRQLLAIENGGVVQLDLETSPASFYHLDAKAGTVMLSTGPKDVILILADRELRID